MKLFLLVAISMFGATAGVQAQQTVSGRWQGSFDIPGPGGSTQHDTAYLILEQNGAEVTGSAGSNEERQLTFHDGRFENSTLTFAFDVRGTTVHFSLVLEGDHLRGTATGLPPDRTAKIAVDVVHIPSPPIDGLLKNFSGSILIMRDGHTLAERSNGLANVEWHIPNTSTTRFHIASLTKQFTAAGILLLAEQGRLRLEDHISQYIENAPEAWKDVTLLQLLTHTSGIVDMTELPPEKQQLTQGGTPAEIAKRFRNQPLDFPPGTQARYSSSGFILLGMVIEKVAGGPYAAFLKKNIFDPLGMHDTGVDNGIDVVENLASGYRQQTGKLAHADFIDMRIPFAAGDMYSTTQDLARWDEALFGGKILREESLKRMTTPGMGDYGLGLVVKDEHSEPVISHTGSIQGFRADLRYYPGRHMIVVVLSNTESTETLTLSQLLADQARSGTVSLRAPASTLRDEVLAADRKLFDAYNSCNIAQISRMFSPDLEFFHDITGLTDRKSNVDALKGRCAKTTKFHRELDEQTVQIFPVPGYGAMEIGIHRFYEIHSDGSSQLDAVPAFANVWKQTPDGWKLTRVLSYGHLR